MQYEAITRNSDFTRAYKRGKSLVHSQVVIYINKNRCGATRVGITASKKIGGAVQRNRARRVIRHALYEALPKYAGSLDFVFVARGQTPHLKSQQLAKTIRKLLQQAGIQLVQTNENVDNTP